MNCSICNDALEGQKYFNLENGYTYCLGCYPGPTFVEHDPVNHPKHYTSHPSGVECITITRHMTFNIGNAIKYLWRCGDKDNQIQDLEKAIWYIKDEINRLKK